MLWLLLPLSKRTHDTDATHQTFSFANRHTTGRARRVCFFGLLLSWRAAAGVADRSDQPDPPDRGLHLYLERRHGYERLVDRVHTVPGFTSVHSCSRSGAHSRWS